MDKTINPSEQDELLKLIENNKEEDFFDVISDLIDTSGKEEISMKDWTSLLANTVPEEDKPAVKIRPLKFLYRSVAAAAVFALISFAAYFYMGHTKKVNVSASSIISPGGNKAILIMEDGKTIQLDSNIKADEVFAFNPNIKSISEGELVYSKDEDQHRKPAGINILRTPKGGQYRVVLPDGTIAILNADSELKFPTDFEDHVRQVELQGEAYFEVTSYPKRKWPFIVKSADQQVQVMGTKFNISAYNDDTFIKTSLLEGKVKVFSKDGQKTLVLKPGQEAALDKNSNNLSVYATDVEESIAWKEGLFVFTNENLHMAMNKIARWYDVEVVYKGNFKDKELWGTISRAEKLENLLKTLQTTGVAKFKIEGRRILVMH